MNMKCGLDSIGEEKDVEETRLRKKKKLLDVECY